MSNTTVTIIGAGLAGCEAAWQLVNRGIPVRLIEMKPEKYSPAHKYPGFAELVCSNSLKAEQLSNASGLLKAELRAMNSLILRCAEQSRVPAGGALAVDREQFSDGITAALRQHPLVSVEHRVVSEMPDAPAIIATGPLTDPALTDAITAYTGAQALNFFDAAAPIVTADSLDMDKVFRASRYGKGTDDYLNCPMTEGEYNAFYDALVGAELAELHDFEKKLVFEGCLAVEILASRGRQTLAFGPLKPVGLVVGRAEAGVRHDPGPGARGIRPLRRDAPQHLPERAEGAGRELRPEGQSADPLRRAADRRGGLHGIHVQRPGGRRGPGLRAEGQAGAGLRRQDRAGRAGAARMHPQPQLPAHERQLRHTGAAGLQGEGQAQPLREAERGRHRHTE